MRIIHSIVLVTAAIMAATGCRRTEPERTFNIPEGGIAFTMEGYANDTKSVNVDASKVTEVETKITDANIWVFDTAGHFLLHSHSAVSDGVASEKLFSVNSASFKLYVVANAGASLSFTPSTEADMKNLVAGFDNKKFNERGLPAAGSGTYTPGGPTPFKLTRLVAKYKLTITDATAGGSKPYEFKFTDGKVVCRNVGKNITPFNADSKPSETFPNSDDIEFLSAAELAAIDSGAAVEKTLYLLENVWTSGATEDAVRNKECFASYVEISGKGTIDKGAGHVYEKVTCRHLFGTDGAGKAGVVRNTLNTLSLSVTNDLLSENGWRVEASGDKYLASAAFSPASLSLTDDEEKTVTITPKDHWAANNDIEYVLETRQVSGSGKNVQIEVDDDGTWKPYTAGTTLKGTNNVRLVNKNTKAGQTKAALWAVAKLTDRNVDLGKADLDLIQVKGHYDFYWEQGLKSQVQDAEATRIDSLVNTGSKLAYDAYFSPKGLPLAEVKLKNSPFGWQLQETNEGKSGNYASFYALRDPVRPKETFTGECDSDFLSIQEAGKDGSDSQVQLHGGKDAGGNIIKHRLLLDSNDGPTREAKVKFSFKEVCEQDPITINVHQIGEQSVMTVGMDRTIPESNDFFAAAEKVWAEGIYKGNGNNKSYAWNHIYFFKDRNGSNSDWDTTESMEFKITLKVGYEITQPGNGDLNNPLQGTFDMVFIPVIGTPTYATTQGAVDYTHNYDFHWYVSTPENAMTLTRTLDYDSLMSDKWLLGVRLTAYIKSISFEYSVKAEPWDYYIPMQDMMEDYLKAVVANFWNDDNRNAIEVWPIALNKDGYHGKYNPGRLKHLELYKGMTFDDKCGLTLDSPFEIMGNKYTYSKIGIDFKGFKIKD